MKTKIVFGVAWGAFVLALGQLVVGIGTKNPEQVAAALTAIVATLLPAITDWFKPSPTPPSPHA